METSSQSLRISKCINFKQHHDNVEAINIVNSKRYILTFGVFDLLKFLEKPKCTSDILHNLIDLYDKETIEKTINYLLINKLIVEDADDEACYVLPAATSLFGLATYNQEHASESKIVFTGVPYGQGNGTNINCMHFPYEIRNYLSKQRVNFGSSIDDVDFQFLSSQLDFSNLKKLLEEKSVEDAGNLFLYPTEYSSSVHEKIYKTIGKLLKQDAIPFTLGGDHSISYPIIKAMNDKYKNFQVLQFDAHTDTYDSAISRMLEGRVSHHHGNFMTKCLELNNLSNVYQFGVRGLSNIRPTTHPKQNYYWIDELYSKVIDAEQSIIDLNVPTYVTFDIDFLDPQIAPGTATPVPSGFLYKETCELLEKLLKNTMVIGVDLVEVNPKLDGEERTLQVAANMILLLLNYIKL